MGTAITAGTHDTHPAMFTAHSGAHQAYRFLHVGFTIAPIVAGVDKFTHLLTDWDKYLPGTVNGMVGGHGHELMLVAGGVEVVAGIGVAMRPRVFSYVVAAWLGLFIINLLMIPGFYDIALRDFGLLLGALALGSLSREEAGD